MAQTYNSAITIVRAVADNALSTATSAATAATAAQTTANAAAADATFAKNRVVSIYTDLNTTYDTQPSANVMANSKNSPVFASLTQARTWSYGLNDLTGATPAFGYSGGTYSDVLKVINIGQSYALTLALANGSSTVFNYVVQPGESICAYYNPSGSAGQGAWVFSASVL
jgi:hypothetical protein